MIVPADTRTHRWIAPHGPGSFRPNGKKIIVGESVRKNPELWSSGDRILAARVFVGLNVGGAPKWSIDDVVGFVRSTREAQGHAPDSSFIIQKGIYKSKITGEVVEEDSVQIVIIDTDNSSIRSFDKEMTELAEKIAQTMEQEEVVVEIQENGMTHKTFGVGP